MPETKPQSFAHHTKWDPWFHFFVAPVFLINVLCAAKGLYDIQERSQIHALILAIAALVAVFLIRIYSLRVQDRLIRLEETLRMKRLC